MSEDGQYLTKRHGAWHYYRRVPSSYTHLDKRGSIKLSTKIKVANDRAGCAIPTIATTHSDGSRPVQRGCRRRRWMMAVVMPAAWWLVKHSERPSR